MGYKWDGWRNPYEIRDVLFAARLSFVIQFSYIMREGRTLQLKIFRGAKQEKKTFL